MHDDCEMVYVPLNLGILLVRAEMNHIAHFVSHPSAESKHKVSIKCHVQSALNAAPWLDICVCLVYNLFVMCTKVSGMLVCWIDCGLQVHGTAKTT